MAVGRVTPQLAFQQCRILRREKRGFEESKKLVGMGGPICVLIFAGIRPSILRQVKSCRLIISCTYYSSCQFTSSTGRESKVVDNEVVILRLTSRKELPMVLEDVGDMIVIKG